MQNQAQVPNDFLKSGAVFLIFLCIALLVFGLSSTFPFMLDDEEQILLNPMVHSLSHLLDAFRGSTMNSGGAIVSAGSYYKPLMTVCYILLWSLFGENTTGYHLFQLLIHTLNATLLFMFLRGFFQSYEEAPGKMRIFSPILLALVFLIHPANVETAIYIANLQDTLYTFFGLLLLLYLQRAEALTAKRATLLGLGMLLTLLSKESGILYLIMSLVFSWIFQRKKFALTFLSFLASVGVYLYLRFGVAYLNGFIINNSKIMQSDLFVRLLTSPLVLFHYFRLFFFPKTISFTEDWVVREPTFPDFWLPLIFIMGVAALFLLEIRRSRGKEFLFFALWTGIGLGAHSQIVPLDGTVADRWFYFPMIGLLGSLGIYWKEHGWKQRWTRKALPVGVLILTALAVRSFIRTLDWENGMTLDQVELAKDPDSYYFNNNLGVELNRRGKYLEAIPYLEKSTRLFPEGLVSWTSLGIAHARLGNLDLAETYFRKSIDLGLYYLAYENYARILLQRGKKSELKQFLETKGLVYFPNNPTLQEIYRSISI